MLGAGGGIGNIGVHAAEEGLRRLEIVGWKSTSSLKGSLGPAGLGRQWHHIVEQRASSVHGFGAESNRHIDDVVSIPSAAHYRVRAYYSSIHEFTKGRTVRDWLSDQTNEEQMSVGRVILDGASTTYERRLGSPVGPPPL